MTVKKATPHVEKSSPKTRNRGAFVKGDPRIQRGRGPKKGAENAGRPPDWWKAKMRELRDRALIAAEAEKVLEDPDHPAWLSATKFMHEAVEGKPATAIDLTSKGKELRALTWKFGDREVTF